MTKGQRIKQRREELNLKQIELAEKVHISKQTLYKYENDIITNIPSNKLEEIAAALDTTPDYLMGWEVEPEYNFSMAQDLAKLSKEPRILKYATLLSKLNSSQKDVVYNMIDALNSTHVSSPSQNQE